MAVSSKRETKSFLFMFAVLVMASIYTAFISENSIVAVIMCLFPVLLLVMQTLNKFKANVFFLVWVCWNIINIFHMLTGVNSYFFRVLIFQNIVIIFVYLSSLYCCSATHFEKSRKVINLFTIILCIIEILFSITGRAQSFSFILFGLMYFFLCDKGKYKYLKLALMAGAFLFGRSRSSILMLLFCLFCFFFLHKIKKNVVLYKAFFLSIAGITYLIPYGYIWLYRSPVGYYLNNFSRSVFKKNFFSGRNVLWIQISEWIEQHSILWGIGSDFVGGKYSQLLGVSTHNVNLFLLGQGGLILLCLFFVLLYNVYMRFFSYIDDSNVIAASAFLLGLMVRSCFDLILVANQFVPSMYAWLCIGMALSYCNFLELRKGHIKK